MHPVSLAITQTWSGIVIRLDSDHSRSYSQTGAIRNLDIFNPELAYIYWNEPRVNVVDSMEAHGGTAILELSEPDLTGLYYTGRGRREAGAIEVTGVAPI